MYTRIIFETAAEYFNACDRGARTVDDKSPTVPQSVILVFDGSEPHLSGEKSELFELGPKIDRTALLEEAFKRLGIGLHLT